ncbi:MAG TPA: hypothetical protein VFD60_14585 [Nitrososphaeraceae archaeon]|nr:hypothetical protein [Nitrososphaeraceae archaeon]
MKFKIGFLLRIQAKNKEVKKLSLIYTPGVAFAAKKISNDINLAYNYTSKWNNVAIVCDGSRILGLVNGLERL